MKLKIILIAILLVLPSACLAQESTVQDYFQSMIYDVKASELREIEIYNKSEIPFTALEFTTVSDFQSAEFEIESFVIKPEQLPEPPYDFIYKYVEVISDLDDYVLKTAEIEFRVKNSWISRYKINRNAIKILRLQGNIWQAFPAEQFDKDKNYTYYSSEVPGFSHLAIVGMTTETAEALARQQELAITPPANESQQAETEENSQNIYYIATSIIAIIIISIIIIYIIIKRRSQPGEKPPEQIYRYSHEFFGKR